MSPVIISCTFHNHFLLHLQLSSMLTVSSLTVPTCAVPRPSLSANCRALGKSSPFLPGLCVCSGKRSSGCISLVPGQRGMQALSLCCKLVLLEHEGVGASSESLQWCPQVKTGLAMMRHILAFPLGLPAAATMQKLSTNQ